jgi:hypothetical protein
MLTLSVTNVNRQYYPSTLACDDRPVTEATTAGGEFWAPQTRCEKVWARQTPHLHAAQGLIGLADGPYRMSACVADNPKH